MFVEGLFCYEGIKGSLADQLRSGDGVMSPWDWGESQSKGWLRQRCRLL
jgi:hypothetical protein